MAGPQPGIRDAAVWLLRAALRMAGSESQPWASGMLRELDFIESDWAALRWALGGTVAVIRHSSRGWVWRRLGIEEGWSMKDFLKNAAGMMAGVATAVALAFCAYGVLLLLLHYFPVFNHSGVPWPAWLIVFAIPETLFVVATVKLWRKWKSVAVGILVAAVIFVTHFAMHFVSHWNE